MEPFCDDIDLICYRPRLCDETPSIAQVLLQCTGDLGGTVLTLEAGALEGVGVRPRMLVRLAGAVAGAFAVTSVGPGDVLGVSVIHAELLVRSDAPPIPVGVAAGVNVSVCTYEAQIALATRRLIDDATGDFPGSALVNPRAFGRAAVLTALELIYDASLATANPSDALAAAAALVRAQRASCLRSVYAFIDTDNDGQADLVRPMDRVRFVRR